MIFKEIFGDKRIIGLAGNKNEGKTNNIVSAILDFRKYNKLTPIYIYGFSRPIVEFLKPYGVIEVSTLKQIVHKKDCFLLIDEFQKLKLQDRRYKDDLDDFIDFVYHNNVRVLLSSPNLREFNSVIGSKIEGWVIKSLDIEDLVNGSHLKRITEAYKGNKKVFKSIVLEKNEMLIINNEQEKILVVDYIISVDTKIGNIDIFKENCQRFDEEKGQEKKSENCIERRSYPYSDKRRWYKIDERRYNGRFK